MLTIHWTICYFKLKALTMYRIRLLQNINSKIKKFSHKHKHTHTCKK